MSKGIPKELIKDLGNDTIRLKGSGDFAAFKKELTSKEYVKTVNVSKEQVHIGVISGQTQLPDIFNLAMKNQFIINNSSSAFRNVIC